MKPNSSFRVKSPNPEDQMEDVTRCPTCNKRLMAITDRHGRTELRCLNCDEIDPMKTDAAKWANSPLAPPAKVA